MGPPWDPGTGDVYVADSVRGVVDVYSSSGVFERKLTGGGSPGGTFLGKEDEEGNVAAVGVEEATGNVYVAERERHVVSQFSGSGRWLGWITGMPSGLSAEPDGVALAASGEVYISDADAGMLDVFGADVVVPDAATNKASNVGKTTALLNGVVRTGRQTGEIPVRRARAKRMGRARRRLQQAKVKKT